MKKYEKPMIILEHYELSQNIADCAWEMNNNADGTCTGTPDQGFFFGTMNGTLFNTEKACTYKVDDGYEEYCYQAGTSGYTLFRS